MLIRKLGLLALIALVCLPLAAGAQEGQYKIGVVDVKEVFDEYDKQIKEYKALEVEKERLQKPITELTKKIEKNQERLKDESLNLSEEERETIEGEIELDYSRYRSSFQQSQEEMDLVEKKVFDALVADIQTAVEEVGAKENYHMVFDGSKTRNNGLLYFSTTLNMTRKIIDHLNKK
jgi:outer membrane protein